MNDEITLVVPAEEDFRQVAQLVVGGLGARLDLTYEDLDDLQTALDAVLACREDAGDIRLVVAVSDGGERGTSCEAKTRRGWPSSIGRWTRWTAWTKLWRARHSRWRRRSCRSARRSCIGCSAVKEKAR